MLMAAEKRAADLLVRSVCSLFRKLTSTVRPSAWCFETSESQSAGVGTPLVDVGFAAGGGNIYLYRGKSWEAASDRVGLTYGGLGLGLGLALPLGGGFSVSASYSSAGWWNTGKLYILGDNQDFASPADFNEAAIGFGPTVVLNVDGAMVPLRWLLGAGVTAPVAQSLPHSDILDRQLAGSAALMFIGINPRFYALLREFAGHCGKLVALMKRPMPEGIFAGVTDSIERVAVGEWDLMRIEYDILTILAQIEGVVGLARAFLVSAGVMAALPGVGITVYYGALKGWKDMSAMIGSDAPILDHNLPAPYGAGGSN